MKTVRSLCIIGTGLALNIFVLSPTPVEARGYGEARINPEQRANRALYGNKIRSLGSGNYRGARRGTYPPVASFSGVTIDPYSLGPTMDGVEIDTAKMTAAVQRRLTARGYYAGPANGQFTQQLERALHRFQSEASCASTGSIDSYTLEHLGLSPSQFAR